MRLLALTRPLVLLLFLLGGAGVAGGQPGDAGRDSRLACSLHARTLALAVHFYAQAHGGKLPPTMYAALEAYAAAEGKPGPDGAAQVARAELVSPAHAGMVQAPKDVTREWVNEHSSYRYLGNAEASAEEVQDWGSIVIVHQRLELGHQDAPTPDNPSGEMFSLAFMDGHVELATRARAEELIESSAATLDSFRTGAPAPDDRQALQNLALILKAVHAYAKAHDGRLPPDLGATLAYLPTGIKATDTAEKRARIYLSPRTRTTRSVPDEPTPEWVNANTWYTYLGSAEVSLEDVPEGHEIALVHARLDDGFPLAWGGGERVMRVPVGVVGGRASLQPLDEATWRARESQRTFASMATGEGLPDWVHLRRDVRVLSGAIHAYAKANAGALPPDLAAVLEHVPSRIPGDPRVDARVRVFLTPRAEAVEPPPAGADAAWARAHTNYVYVATPGAKVTELTWPANALSVHSPFDEAFRLEEAPRELLRVAIGDSYAGAWTGDRAWVEEAVREMRAPKSAPAEK